MQMAMAPTGWLDTDPTSHDFFATKAQLGMLGQGDTTMGGGGGQEGERYIQETGEKPSRTKQTNADEKLDYFFSQSGHEVTEKEVKLLK
jgi:hypothetical protein